MHINPQAYFRGAISPVYHPNCYNTSMSQTNNTGTYVYDKKLGKVVKVSSRVPSVSIQKSAPHVCNGCCGHCACHDD